MYVNGTLGGSHKGGYTLPSALTSQNMWARAPTRCLWLEGRRPQRPAAQGKTGPPLRILRLRLRAPPASGRLCGWNLSPSATSSPAKYYPDPANGKVTVTGLESRAERCSSPPWEDKPVGEAGFFTAQLDLSETHLWGTRQGGFAHPAALLRRGKKLASACAPPSSRTVPSRAEVLFQPVLDQGFYPAYTTPTEKETLMKGIRLSLPRASMLARLHEKVFGVGFLYPLGQLGLPGLGQYPQLGPFTRHPLSHPRRTNQWSEAVERAQRHPHYRWCPSTWGTGGGAPAARLQLTALDPPSYTPRYRPSSLRYPILHQARRPPGVA